MQNPGDKNKGSSRNEDILVKDSVQNVAKLYSQVVIWYTPDTNSKQTILYRDQFICTTLCTLRTHSSPKELFEDLKYTQSSVQVIVSQVDSEALIKKVLDLRKVSKIYIIGGDNDRQKALKRLDPRVVCIGDKYEDLISKVNGNMIKRDFPVFGSYYDEMDKSDINNLHYYLKGFIGFTDTDRQQAKKDFLNLSTSVFSKDLEKIKEFSDQYQQYSREGILKWYTTDSFFNEIVNRSLRIGTPDTILYCRLPLKDLEMAIKEEYRKQADSFSGLLYQRCYIHKEEWKKLEQNEGKDIEIYGFLSATKNKEVTLGLAGKGNVLITIIVPANIDKRGKGFVDMEKLEGFRGEKEVLFNIRSKFTVLEVMDEGEVSGVKCRELVLLYGAHSIYKSIRKIKSEMEIQLKNSKMLKCHFCKHQGESLKESLVFVNLWNTDQYICGNCISKYQMKQSNNSFEESEANKTKIYNMKLKKCDGCRRKFLSIAEAIMKKGSLFCQDCILKCQLISSSSFLCLPLSLHNIKSMLSNTENKIIGKIYGLYVQYQQDLNIPFYGYKCRTCQGKKLVNCYKCVTCKDPSKTWCQKCFDQNNGCLSQQHWIVLENQPYSCWGQKMPEDDYKHLDYYRDLIDDSNEKFKQSVAFIQTKSYDKAIEVLLKYKDIANTFEEKDLIALHWNLGAAYFGLGKYKEAIESLQKSLEISQNVYQKKDLTIANSYLRLGIVHFELGEYKQALPFYSKALEVYSSMYGEKHFDVAKMYLFIGETFQKLGQHAKAIDTYTKSLNILQSIFDKKHPMIAKLLQYTGHANFSLNNHQKAINYYKKSIETNKLVYGDKHPSIADLCNDLAKTHINLNDNPKALEFYLKNLEITRYAYGENHLNVAKSYTNLGTLYSDMGKHEEAIKAYSKALEITKAVLGYKHPEVAATYASLGSAYFEKGEYQKAIENSLKSLEISDSVYEGDHPSKAEVYSNIGAAYSGLLQYDKAESFYLKSLEIKRNLYGDKHSETSLLYNNLGEVYCGLRNDEKAIECFEKALEIDKSVYGENHSSLADIFNNIGVAYGGVGDYKKAIEFCKKSLGIKKDVYGDKHPDLALDYHNIGTIYHEMGDYQNAIGYYHDALEIIKSVYGKAEGHPDSAEFLNSLGVAYFELGDDQNAIRAFSQALEANRLNFGNIDGHPNSAEFLIHLGNIYERVGELQNAMQNFTKAIEVKRKFFGEKDPNIVLIQKKIQLISKSLHLNKS